MKVDKKSHLLYFLMLEVLLILTLFIALIFIYPKLLDWGKNREKMWREASKEERFTQGKASVSPKTLARLELGVAQISNKATLSDKGQKNTIKTLWPAKVDSLRGFILGNCKNSSPCDSFLPTRALISTKLYQTLPFARAQLLESMIFGGTQDLEESTKHNLKVIGMQHVLAASGYNVGLIVGVGSFSLRRFWGRQGATLGIVLLVWVYILIAGISSSLLRAGVMATLTLSLTGWFYQQVKTLWLWSLTGGVLLSWNPELVSDISFQLSMMACLGIIVFSPLWPNQASWLTGLEVYQFSMPPPLPKGRIDSFYSSVKSLLKEQFYLTLSAQTLTLPLVAYHFQEINLSSFWSNPLLGWLTPGLTLGGLGLLFSGWVGQILPFSWFGNGLVGLGVSIMTGFFLFLAELLAQVSWVFSDVEVSLGMVLAWYTAFLGLAGWLHWRRNTRVKMSYLTFFSP